jgi:hypothetical protein
MFGRYPTESDSFGRHNIALGISSHYDPAARFDNARKRHLALKTTDKVISQHEA